MGLFSRKKKDLQTINETVETVNTEALDESGTNEEKVSPSENDKTYEELVKNSDANFVMGIECIAKTDLVESVAIIGRAYSTIHVGDACYVNNTGDDKGKIYTSIVSKILLDGEPVSEVTDKRIIIELENADQLPLRTGTVIFTRNSTAETIHNAYINALGDYYITKKKMELTDTEYDVLSIADLAELYSMYNWSLSKRVTNDEDISRRLYDLNENKFIKLKKVLSHKILHADVIYAVFSRLTDEPQMFSKTYVMNDGSYRCEEPRILIYPEAYRQLANSHLNTGDREVKAIRNDAEKKVIASFFEMAFYMNGACRLMIINPETLLTSEEMIPKPDYSNLDETKRPLMNPDLERWILMIGQMGNIDNPDKEKVFNVYNAFLDREVLNAKLLVPSRYTYKDGVTPDKDENGTMNLSEGGTMTFCCNKGKDCRDAIRMYTDWRRLKVGMKSDDWNGTIMTIADMIDRFDCAINVTDFHKAGCYISKSTYEDIKKRMENVVDLGESDQTPESETHN